MKIFFYSCKTFENPYLTAANTQKLKTGCTQQPLSIENVDLVKGYNVVSVFTGDDVSAPVIEALKNNGIGFIAIRAAGYDNVDIDKAKQLGIKVANVPAYSPSSVAEHAIAMMLALNRKLILADKQVHEQNFTLDKLIGFDLHEKTVGIIGTGKIGAVVAKILHGFGCRILAYDISRRPDLEMRYNVHYVGLELLCRSADIITLHTPLNEKTKYLINKKQLLQMKEGVMLINTSRGAVVNTTALVDFLETGQVGYFGMDVYEKEKGLFFYDHSGEKLNDNILAKLMAMPNVLITPHQGFATSDALANIAATTYGTVACWGFGLDSHYELPERMMIPELYEEEEQL